MNLFIDVGEEFWRRELQFEAEKDEVSHTIEVFVFQRIFFYTAF